MKWNNGKWTAAIKHSIVPIFHFMLNQMLIDTSTKNNPVFIALSL
jgi:hypothetical protein